ncbi:hypothetical protein E3N88_23897 [Mikania micrantha]|uniref:Reverse transcriptase Ty1/copia-type domain-containing protein n=1 Tax=Mikania micrantha TaxID=192012 RepID=A0A5N6NEJ2_9ASTR|nr:hypothetical protein E3N88_23897 [Mikania micrantha]
MKRWNWTKCSDPEKNSSAGWVQVPVQDGDHAGPEGESSADWSQNSPLTQTPTNQNLSPISLFDVAGTYSEGEQVLESGNSQEESPQTGDSVASSKYDDTPPRFRPLAEIYDSTVPLEPRELLLVDDEPTSFEEAVTYKEWKEAMEAELSSIEKNSTWSLTDLPVGQKAIGLKWVFKLKKDANGHVTKCKARLVAKGYVQRKGIDFEEVYAPVARMETIRLLLAIASREGWLVHHLDVKSAFLNGELQEEVYVKQPEGFEIKGKENKVYKLTKALYGLRQAPRAWNARLDKVLKEIGFDKCAQEPAVYKSNKAGTQLIVGVYVDDLIVTGTSEKRIQEFKERMMKVFDMSDLGHLSYYLGIEVTQKQGGCVLKQSGYAKKILKFSGMTSCNPAKWPMDPKLKLTKDEQGECVDSTEYRRLIGSLRYLLHTRPDLSYPVGVLSRYMEKPKISHYQAMKQVLRYVKGTSEYGLRYETGGDGRLIGYSDSSHASDLDDRKGTTGMVFYLGSNLITWVSQKQQTVALSSCEAEFMAATAAATQALWLRNLISDLLGEKPQQVVLLVDNESALSLMKNPVFHGRSKHIDTKYHFIRECVERNQICVKHVSGELQKADIMTKALPRYKFESMRKMIGVEDFEGESNIKGESVV